MLTRGQAQENTFGMDLDQLALRPKASPIANQEHADGSARIAEAASSPAPLNRKRKASSIGADDRSVISQDAVETQVEVLPPMFVANGEVKLLSKRLREYTSPVPEIECQTPPETSAENTVNLEMTVPQSTTLRANAHVVFGPEFANTESSTLEKVASEINLPKYPMPQPRRVTSRPIAFSGMARLDLDDKHNIARIGLPTLDPSVGIDVEAQGSLNQGVPLFFTATLPRKSRNESLARPIGSHTSFIEQATAQNRVAARWKNQPASFYTRTNHDIAPPS